MIQPAMMNTNVEASKYLFFLGRILYLRVADSTALLVEVILRLPLEWGK